MIDEALPSAIQRLDLLLLQRFLGHEHHPMPLQSRIVWHWTFRAICAAVHLFLIVPILAIVPLSFNDSTFLTYPLKGVSLRWYGEFFSSEKWLLPLRNSFLIAVATTAFATVLGTLASLGLMPVGPRTRSLVTAFLILPTFVVITVTATLQVFNPMLARAASSLGAPPLTVFRLVVLPLILPGVAPGALFAFAEERIDSSRYLLINTDTAARHLSGLSHCLPSNQLTMHSAPTMSCYRY